MIIGVYGYHDSGKTLFLEKMMKELRKRDITAAAIKHLGKHYESDDEDTLENGQIFEELLRKAQFLYHEYSEAY